MDAGKPSCLAGLGFALAVQGREDEALAAWQSAGEGAKEFIQWGKLAWKMKQYEEALVWYERAVRAEPELDVGWHHLVTLYQVTIWAQPDEFDHLRDEYYEKYTHDRRPNHRSSSKDKRK